eukprot:PLAT9947.1.p1 GENE.PLAT9947.1~~PLAT9947.1.p1  ORF type:complete len:417 (+),score=103.29 PLAT9947.1:28-1251(+)
MTAAADGAFVLLCDAQLIDVAAANGWKAYNRTVLAALAALPPPRTLWPPHRLRMLRQAVHVVSFRPGSPLTEKGKQAVAVWLLLSGEADIFSPTDGRHTSTLVAPAFAGISALPTASPAASPSASSPAPSDASASSASLTERSTIRCKTEVVALALPAATAAASISPAAARYMRAAWHRSTSWRLERARAAAAVVGGRERRRQHAHMLPTRPHSAATARSPVRSRRRRGVRVHRAKKPLSLRQKQRAGVATRAAVRQRHETSALRRPASPVVRTLCDWALSPTTESARAPAVFYASPVGKQLRVARRPLVPRPHSAPPKQQLMAADDLWHFAMRQAGVEPPPEVDETGDSAAASADMDSAGSDEEGWGGKHAGDAAGTSMDWQPRSVKADERTAVLSTRKPFATFVW